MNEQEILEELLAILEQNGVAIRTEAMGGGGGGLCLFKDKRVFFVDTDAQTTDMAAVCVKTVLELTDVDSIYIKPQLREFIEKYGRRL